MASLTLNGHLYRTQDLAAAGLAGIHPDTGLPVFPDSFFADLLAEVDTRLGRLLPTQAPSVTGVRNFDVQPAPPPVQHLAGLSFQVRVSDDGVNQVPALWAIPTPGGGIERVEFLVPEDQRAAMADAIMKGDDIVTGVFQATLPQALDRFAELWGAPGEVVPPPDPTA